MKSKWIRTSGGPLVVASKICADIWMGVDGSSAGHTDSDYKLACDVEDYVDTIDCGGSKVLILGDEPLQSAFFVVDDVLFVARWVYCESYELADSVIRTIPASNPCELSGVQFLQNDSSMILFDSATSLKFSNGDYSEINAPPGDYIVTTESLRRDKSHEFIIHRFIRRNSSEKV
ncbi:immunity 21 family protein [Acidovorax sp. NCPPB 2350]|nr:immunity 21 family protein [Acidovorax sp. NCPPB 2350]